MYQKLKFWKGNTFHSRNKWLFTKAMFSNLIMIIKFKQIMVLIVLPKLFLNYNLSIKNY